MEQRRIILLERFFSGMNSDVSFQIFGHFECLITCWASERFLLCEENHQDIFLILWFKKESNVPDLYDKLFVEKHQQIFGKLYSLSFI